MWQPEPVVFAGLGAVGCSYAAAMQEAGVDVWALAGGERAKQLEQGVVLNGGRTLHFPLLSPGETAKAPAGLLIFAVKFYALPAAIEDARACVGRDTVILSLLNGVGAEELLQRAFPENTVLYGRVAGLTANRTAGQLERGTLGRWQLGLEKNDPNALHPAVSGCLSLCRAANIPASAPADMLHAVWWKLMANAGLNQCSAVLRAPYGVFQTVPEARSMLLAAMEEVRLAAPAAGVTLLPEEADEYLALIDRMEPWGKTSMLQDVEAGRQTEVDVLAGSVLRYGKRLGVKTPVNQFLLWQIKALTAMAQSRKIH